MTSVLETKKRIQSKVPRKTSKYRWIPTYETRFGLKPTLVAEDGKTVTLAVCQFCTAFGRELKLPAEKEELQAKSVRSVKKGFYKCGPNFRVDNIQTHLRNEHPIKWEQYNVVSALEKQMFFGDTSSSSEIKEDIKAFGPPTGTPAAVAITPSGPSSPEIVPSAPAATLPSGVYKVHVAKENMKFNAAHFIAFKGFRENLHGHNYKLSVTLTGKVGPDGYVIDFGDIKAISRAVCKRLNETFLVPMESDALQIKTDDEYVTLITECEKQFVFPIGDCSLLPIVHSSAEELAIYISGEIIKGFTLERLQERGVTKLQVGIAEAENQMASFERVIDKSV